MQHILLPEESGSYHYYRANLHCHSDISDGHKSPEQLKRDYLAHGYSVIAYTDHNLFITHNDLTDDRFIALNGYEMNINDYTAPVHASSQTCHICFIALDPSIEKQFCYHRTEYAGEHLALSRPRVKYDENEPDFVRNFNEECINAAIDKAHAAGFYVTYNHPTWSLMSYPHYMLVHNADAVEVYNHDCYVSGFEELNSHCYDDFCRRGDRVAIFATDDNHNKHPDTDPGCDSYGGATMICATGLTYAEIAEALRSKRTYATVGSSFERGPEFRYLGFDPETREITVRSSDVRRISLTSDARSAASANTLPGESKNEAVLTLNKHASMFRVTLEDHAGHRAYSRTYFLDEFTD